MSVVDIKNCSVVPTEFFFRVGKVQTIFEINYFDVVMQHVQSQ